MHNGYKLNLYDDDSDDSNYEPKDARWNKGTTTSTTTTSTTTNTNTNSENNNECYE